jgi:hypothetical protein
MPPNTQRGQETEKIDKAVKPSSPIPNLPGLSEAPPEKYGRGFIIGAARGPARPKPG